MCAVGLNRTAYLVQEDDRQVEVCVNANCSAFFSFGVDVTFYRDTAGMDCITNHHLVYVFITCVSQFLDPGEDYQAVSRRRLTFSADDREWQKCFNGIIYDRPTVENTEQFFVSLTRPTGLSDRIKIIRDLGYVTIVDDDGKCYITIFSLIIHYSLVPPAAFVGMQRVSYSVREGENPDVAVIVHLPRTAHAHGCPVQFPFNLHIYTGGPNDTAGTVYWISFVM